MARPTSIRYVILGLTTLVAVTLYLDRYCFTSVAQDIKDQLRLLQWEIDWLQGAFFVTYALGQLPCGWLSDRFGQRLMLTFYLFAWSLLTGLMGLATTFGELLLFRFGCGLFEAGAYPSCVGLIRRWIPYEQRGLASGIVSIGGRIGGAITFPLTAYLLVAFAPASTSSLFTTADVIDAPALARQLVNPGSAPAGFARIMGERLETEFTTDEKQFLRGLAAQDDGTASAADQARLAGILNRSLLLPDLLKGVDLDAYAARIPPEALERPRGPGETARLRRNRLLLEVALPNRVCKLYGWGWRPTLIVFGMAGVTLALVFGTFVRNEPRRHPLVNSAEVELIESGPGATTARIERVPASALWYGILTNRSLWLSSVVQFGTNFGWVFLGTKLSEYLERVHQVPKIEQGWMVGLSLLVSVPMTVVGGWWTDRLTRTWGPRLGRSFPIASTRFVAAGAFVACILFQAPWPVVLALCVVSVASDMGLPAIWAFNLDVGGRNVGLILGWGNMWGNLGAAVSPYFLGRVQTQFDWNAVFLTCAAVFVVIGVAALGIDATQPVATGIVQQQPP